MSSETPDGVAISAESEPLTESLAWYAVQGSTAVVTRHRPERRNTFNRALSAALTQHFRRAADDSGVRAVILTAHGSAFYA